MFKACLIVQLFGHHMLQGSYIKICNFKIEFTFILPKLNATDYQKIYCLYESLFLLTNHY